MTNNLVTMLNMVSKEQEDGLALETSHKEWENPITVETVQQWVVMANCIDYCEDMESMGVDYTYDNPMYSELASKCYASKESVDAYDSARDWYESYKRAISKLVG